MRWSRRHTLLGLAGALAVLAAGLRAAAAAEAPAASQRPSGAAPEKRLVLTVSVLPQLEQHIHDTPIWVELYGADLLVRSGPVWRFGGGLSGRSDFLLLRAGAHRNLWASPTREWRLGMGLEYLVPLSETESIYRKLKGESSSTTDRTNVFVAVGQTFGLEHGRLAFRVEYVGRAVLADSVLGMLESLDDEIEERDGYLVHAFAAGVELRLGRLP